MFVIKKQAEIEKQVLSCCMQDIESIYQASELISAADFSIEKNKSLFNLLIAASTILKENNSSDMLVYLASHRGSNDYKAHELVDILSELPSASNLPVFLRQLVNYSRLRKFYLLNHAVNKSIEAGNLVFEEQAKVHQEQFHPLIDSSDRDINTEELYNTVKKNANNLCDGASKIRGYSWGLKKLDKMTSGIIPGKTYVIGGLKKSGKSKLVINTVANCLKEGVPAGILSLEMQAEFVGTWVVGRLAHVDSDRINSGYMNKSERSRFNACIEWIKQNSALQYIDDRSHMNTTTVRSMVRKWSRLGVKIVFMDYLQILHMPAERGETRAYAIQKATTEIARIAKEYKVAFIYLSQLKNSSEGQVAGIGDLKESGGIGESVDCAIIVNNMDRINKKREKENIAKFVVEQRDGVSGEIQFWMRLKYSEYLDKLPGDYYQEDCDILEVGEQRESEIIQEPTF